MSPEARAAIDAVLPDAPDPSASGRVIVAFDDRLSPRGQYGHLGVYKYIIRIENVTSAQMEHPS